MVTDAFFRSKFSQFLERQALPPIGSFIIFFFLDKAERQYYAESGKAQFSFLGIKGGKCPLSQLELLLPVSASEKHVYGLNPSFKVA